MNFETYIDWKRRLNVMKVGIGIMKSRTFFVFTIIKNVFFPSNFMNFYEEIRLKNTTLLSDVFFLFFMHSAEEPVLK